jgi:hypothetical protein
VNFERGAKRVWLVATVLWFAYAVAHYGYAIGSWTGYHWSLLSRHDSLHEALRDKERNKNMILACARAFEYQCQVIESTKEFSQSIDSNIYLDLIRTEKDQMICLDSPQFLERLVFEARGLQEPDAGKIKNGAACVGYTGAKVPEIEWFPLTIILLAPVLPIFIYILGLWIYRGFAT